MDGLILDVTPAATTVATRAAEWPIAPSAVAPMIASAIVALILISLADLTFPTKGPHR